jgi:hypothetical protein
MARAATARILVLVGAIHAGLCFSPPAYGQTVEEIARTCRRVGDVPSGTGTPQFIRIDPDAAAQLAQIGLDRAAIFDRMAETAIPETMGCWAMPVGNFDSQLVSVGMAQRNYGTGSLQPQLLAWRDSFASRRRFKRELARFAPTYGRLFFSKDCLTVPVRDKCRAGILAAHGPDGKLNAIALAELTRLFEHDAMLQVQTDTYVGLLLEVRGELLRLWPTGPITPRKVKWAIDTRVQQKTLPGDEDVARLRRKLADLTPQQRPQRLKAMLAWYQGLSEAVDQDGVGRDYAWNLQHRTCLIATNRVDDEQSELLHLTFLRSRTATGNSGRWQALTFSRRAKIILDVGSVSGVRDGQCTP